MTQQIRLSPMAPAAAFITETHRALLQAVVYVGMVALLGATGVAAVHVERQLAQDARP